MIETLGGKVREIKFRAWDTNDKTWATIDGRWDFRYNMEDGYFFTVEGPENESWTEAVTEGSLILQQYTGLKDKNGREIYEGDILAGIMLSGVVQWNNSLAKYTVQLSPEGWHDLSSLNYMKEVIGNIYDNPELLSGKK
jgi:hypothetical protein